MFGNKLHSSLPRGFPWFQATHLQTPVLTRDLTDAIYMEMLPGEARSSNSQSHFT